MGSCKDFGGRRVCYGLLLISPHHQHVRRLQHCSIADFAKYNTYGSGLDFNPIQTNLLASGGFTVMARCESTFVNFQSTSVFFFLLQVRRTIANPTCRCKKHKTGQNYICCLESAGSVCTRWCQQHRLYCHLGFTAAYKENEKLLLWCMAVAQELERSSWLVRLILGWPLEDLEACSASEM